MNKTRPIKSLIIAELDGNISVDEKELLYNWIAKSENNLRYYSQIKDLWEASIKDASKIAQTSREWERFTQRVAIQPQDNKWKIKLSLWYRVAAVLVIALLLANLLYQEFKAAEPVYFTSMAPEGSVSQTILPDGTIIFLNAGSEIKYDVNTESKSREVFINGEAWFDVERNEKKPFIVHTPYYDVKVLGTQFNVKTYDEDETVVTTLEEGSIQVLSTENLKLQEDILLEPGEQLIYNKSKRKLNINTVETRLYTSWKDNKLIFLSMPFGDLVKLLERKYGVDIEVLESDILKEHYSGTIKNETILEILNIIEHTHPIRYEIQDQKIIIQKK
ncbi:FecR domain-containing protein [uncultured Draconibacterium sp.]|uniref:FecR family protein n=1 Tax=uncultured Draconibacterium sp. TaxID=1573823 RepID=UPI00326094A5